MTEKLQKKKQVDNRLVLIQYICAMIVVFIHANTSLSWNLTQQDHALSLAVQDFLAHVWRVAVPTFFFISGYFMFFSFEPKKYVTVVKKRFFSLAVPFVVWHAIFYLLYYLVQKIPFLGDKMNREPIPLSLTYFLKEAFLGEGFAPLWYLKELFFYTLLSIVFYYVLKNKYIGAAFIAVLIGLNCFFIDKAGEFIYWLPVFLIGAFFGTHIKRVEFSSAHKRLKLAAALLILLGVLAVHIATPSLLAKYAYRLVSGGLFTFIMASVLKKERQLPWIFTISLFIYCTHGFVLQAVQKVYLVLLGATNLTSLLCYFTAPFVTVALITVAALLLQRFLPRLWQFLNGGRVV